MVKQNLSEGQIIYKISYPYLDSNDISLNLLPKEMTLTFKGDHYKAESIGGMGLFAAGFISDNKEKTMDYFMKVISSKYASRFTNKGVKRFHSDFPSYRLEKLDTTRNIAGMDCNATRVIFYNNIDDLASKIKYYSKNDTLRKKIAKSGQNKYFKLFNGRKVAKHIVDISLGNKSNLF